MKGMTKEERALLLYLETRVVDHNGLIDARNMSHEDFEIAKRWDEEGFVKFGRLTMAEMGTLMRSKSLYRTHFIRMTGESFRAAHIERRARARRTIKRWEENYFRPAKLGEEEVNHDDPR